MAGRKGREQDAVPRIGDVVELPPEFDALQAVIDANEQPVFALDRELRYTAFNQAHATVMRNLYGAEIMLGGHLTEYQTVAADRETSVANLERALAGEQVTASAFSGEEGRRRSFEVVHSPQADVAGTIIGVVVRAYDVTERQRAEDELESERRDYATIFDASPVMIVYKSKDDHILRVNDAFARFIGLPKDEIIGMTTFDVANPRETAHLGRADDIEVVRTGTPRLNQLVFFTSPFSDSAAWVLFSKLPFRDSSGEAIGTVSFVTDVNDRKLAEDALESSEKRYREVLEYGDVGVAYFSIDGRVLLMNRRAVQNLGGSDARQFVGKSLTELFGDEAGSMYLERIHEAADSAEAVEYVECVNLPIGPRWLASIHTRSLDATGSVVGVHVYAQDITERKRVEAELAAAASEWRQTFDAMPDSVALFDRDGRVLRCNAATTVLTGRDFDDIIGRPCYEVFHGTHEYHADCPQRRAFESRQVETSFIEQDGQWLRVTFEPEIDGAGRVSGGVHVVTDVSELKQTERQLLESIRKQQAITDGVIAALARTIEVRDPYTAGHERRVSELATGMARHLELDEESVRGVQVAAMLHDLGKITIPAEILSKPGRLSATEFELIKGHSKAGFDILAAIDFGRPVAEIALQHHERQDGSGYPEGLRGNEIMREARILAVADVVEAMVSHRPYRPALGVAAALEEVRSGAGTRYDAHAAAACERVFEQGFVFTEP